MTRLISCALGVFSILAYGLVSPTVDAAEKLDKPVQEKERENIRTLLEKVRASGSLPEGMVIRIGACLGARERKDSSDLPDELKETWEFTSNQAHRLVVDYEKGKVTYNRVESRPFDSKGICNDLLDGKAIEIQARSGEGSEVGFVGTSYHLGSRFIEVVWNEETILELLESNTAGRHLYRESDARAFGALYERLASQARVSFKPKSVEVKK